MKIQKLSEEELSQFNKKLNDNYGYFEGHPKFRLVWAPDVIEKRLTKHTKEGLELLTPVIVELPKYKQFIGDRYVLEMRSIIGDNPELAMEQVNYEPFYTFEDRNREFLIPKWSAAKIIIEHMLMIAGVKNPAKYNLSNEQEREALVKRVDELEEALYGNETKVGDALAHDSAVGFGKRSRSDSFDPKQKIEESLKRM